jgi:hypothetical protein
VEVLYEEFVFRGTSGLPLAVRVADPLVGLVCAIFKKCFWNLENLFFPGNKTERMNISMFRDEVACGGCGRPPRLTSHWSPFCHSAMIIFT